MPPLDRSPRLDLRAAPFVFFSRMPADRGRIEQHLGTEERRDARRLGIPLVPADQHADGRIARLPHLEAVGLARALAVVIEVSITGSEVVLLVEQRIVG